MNINSVVQILNLGSDLVTQPSRRYWLEPGLCTSQYIIIIYMIEAVTEISEKLLKNPPLHFNGFCIWVWKKNLYKNRGQPENN